MCSNFGELGPRFIKKKKNDSGPLLEKQIACV